MATLSALPALLISSHILYHVFDNALRRARLLESLAAKTHFQTHHVAPTLQLFSLHPDPIDLGHLGSIPNDLRPQRTIVHASEHVAHMLGCRKVRLQHPHCFVGERLDLLGPIIGRCV